MLNLDLRKKTVEHIKTLYTNKSEINSLLIAIFLSTNIIGWVIPISNISIILSVLILIAFFINNGSKMIISREKLVLLVFITLWFTISAFTKNGHLDNLLTYFTYFIIFVPVAFIITEREFNKQSVYKYIMIISIFAIPYFIMNNFFLDYSYGIKEQSESIIIISYTLVPVIISCIILVFSKQEKIWCKIIALLLLLIYSYTMISISSRGAILAIIAYFILRILFYKPKPNRLYLKIIVTIILIISIILVICFIKEILKFIDDTFEKISINSIPLQRIMTKVENGGDLTSGRIEIYKQALDDISHSFILGNGIAAFEDQHGGYVHNVFLQIIYEGGLICIGYFIYLMFSLMKNLITQPKEEVKFLIFMISISLVQLMMSLFYWYSPKFWLLIGYLIYLKRITKEVKNKNEIL